jgi:hypothetical protein
MATFEERRSAAAALARRAVDQVLQIAHSVHASTAVSGGSKPHVTITKQVADYNDTYFRALLSGIEYATRSHFDQGRETGGCMDWVLRSRLVDVTVRGSKT